jgi:hypothetical protein
MGTGEQPTADANHRADGICLEGRSGNVSGGGLHGFFDETNQARGAVASDQGVFPNSVANRKG